MSTRKIDKPKSLTLLALDKIRDGITHGEYPLGSPLYEKVLAAEFGISKTPVREALMQLQREGLVVVQPHSGTFVFELADGEVSELCELRLILETNALQLAMRRQAGRLAAEIDALAKAMRASVKQKDTARYRDLDTEFHRAFFKHCGNSHLANMYAMIDGKLQTLRVSLVTPLPNLLNVSLNEHVQIAKALQDSKLPAALEILADHIKRARELMHSLHETKPVTVEKMS